MRRASLTAIIDRVDQVLPAPKLVPQVNHVAPLPRPSEGRLCLKYKPKGGKNTLAKVSVLVLP